VSDIIYDTIIIGAGIAGCCAGFSLSQSGQSVLMVDRSSSPASGGSGAAGAFVSPKIGKESALHELTNESYVYARDFYLKYFGEHFYQTGVIRMPKDADDAQKFGEYEAFNDTNYEWISKYELDAMGIKNTNDSFLFKEAGVCDAPAMCRAVCDGLPFRQFSVKRLEHDDKRWLISDNNEILLAKNIVLATGHESSLFDMRYMGIRGTWGSRGDYYSKLALDVSMHKNISISANIDGVVKIGATHVRSGEPCMVCDGRPLKSLEDKASMMIDSDDFVLKETFCGMRAGSKDYFPLVGRVVDVVHMLEHYPSVLKGAKPKLKYIDNLYVINGLGGRGFVFAPLMSKILSKYMLLGEEIDSRVNPDRLFFRWTRRLKG